MRGGRSGCHRCRRLRGRRAQRTGGNNYDVPDPRCPESDLSPPFGGRRYRKRSSDASGTRTRADGVQIGTRFALTKESSAHENFKKLCLNLKEGDTKLLLKKLSPTRLVKGDFATAVEEAEARGASVEELRELLGKGRAKKGIFEGDLKEGELEIGQVASLFWEELSVEEVMKELIRDFKLSLENVKTQLCS